MLKSWFLVVLFHSTPNAKIAIFPTEAACEKAMPSVTREFKNNNDVKVIFCSPGELNKEKSNEEEKEGDWL